MEIIYRCDRDPRQPLSPEELSGVEAVIADLESYDRELLTKLGRGKGGSLGLIMRYGVGVDSVDLDAATESGVFVANTPGANARPTAEWAVATLLDIAGRRQPHHERARDGLSKTGPSRLDVSGETLGIVGTGTIGKSVAALLSGFEMKVLASDPFPDHDWARAIGAQYVSLEELCEASRFVTLHASASTTLIGPEELDCMDATTALINCARGILVDNREAYERVRSGKLWGYGIDEVWPETDLDVSGLNIVTSPHVGSDTDRGKLGMQRMTALGVLAYMSGEVPEHVLNPEAQEA
jgi:D-3-phosphoglycerate dehydrogenase